MATRKRIRVVADSPPPDQRKFFSSGCALLDCVLGGGWAVGKVANIVGDKSTGKTLLAIEACANFSRAFAGSPIDYIEAESAFDETYARSIGLPEENLNLIQDVRTVEEMWRRIGARCDDADPEQPKLTIVDSLDALSDEAEMEKKEGEGSYGTGKAKSLSEGFRKNIDRISAANMHLMIISQVRDRIGFGHGKAVKRSGGHAIDFYASQVLWLYELGKIKKTVGGLTRSIGLEVKAVAEKNKVGFPWRDCELSVLYGYGIDDVRAAFEWVKKVAPERIGDLNEAMTKENFSRHISKLDRSEVGPWVTKIWNEIHDQFEPPARKYT